jgi:NAD(P)-dependent dehydrogenase (short-subunit alcohol dehydrogenase family)
LLGASVFITGRDGAVLERALRDLSRKAPGRRIGGATGDVGRSEDLERAAREAQAFLGGIDHWINNAGISQEPGRLWELSPDEMERVVRTDLLGPLFSVRAALPALEASKGFLWFMEGHGSDGRFIDGMSLYGTTKRGVAYIWRCLAKEARGRGIRVGALSPGIMATDFTLQNREKTSPEKWERTARVFNILADQPETVAAFLAPRVLAARKSGTRIAWLTNAKVMRRFLAAPFVKRHIIEEALSRRS